jgi:carbon monoxide dehydrogenase subunit G
MELTNEFTVPVPFDQAWSVLTDIERIAPCLPGAQLREVVGDEFRGIVKVKVGPITAQYRGSARFVERDADAGRAVIEAEGRDARSGTARATVSAQLTPTADGTTVAVTTDLHVTGRVAQFGRGVLADVSGRLLDQFAERLRADVLDGATVPPAVTGSEPAPHASAAPADRPPPAEVEAVDLLQTAGSPLARRLVPLLAGVVLLAVLAAWQRHRRR